MKRGSAITAVAFIFAGLLSLCGCQEKNSAQEQVTLANLPMDAVLVEVNGIKLTKQRYVDEVALREKLFNIIEPAADSQMNKQALSGIRSGVLSRFIQTSLLLSGLADFEKTNNVPQFAASYESKRISVASKYNDQFVTSKYKGYDSVALELGDAKLQQLFATIREEDISAQSFIDAAYADEIQLSDDMVSTGLVNVAKYNAKAEAANEATFALATNTFARIQGGESFELLADTVSQDSDKNPGGDLGERTETDFLDEDGYWKVVSGLYDGEVSDVIKTSVGWEIVKCIRQIPADKSESGEVAVHLARIYFRRAMLCKDDYTPEEFKDEMENSRREQTMSRVLNELWRNAHLTFPYGDAILPRTNWQRMPGYPSSNSSTKVNDV